MINDRVRLHLDVRRYVAHARNGKPVVVTENGLETDHDERRAWYIGRASTRSATN